MIRLVSSGPHQRLESDLCTACPQGVTGCCATPPAVTWADLGRIVLLGGADWLLAEITAARLAPCARGLGIRRVLNPDAPRTGLKGKCVYHGEAGCTLPHDRRSATCNYYVCDDALDGGSPALRDELEALYAGWDRVLAGRIEAVYGSQPAFGRPFLDWLAAQTATLMGGIPGEP